MILSNATDTILCISDGIGSYLSVLFEKNIRITAKSPFKNFIS